MRTKPRARFHRKGADVDDQVRRWVCHACGTPVSSNCTGQVRDETGSHHSAGGSRCISVMQDTIQRLRARVSELEKSVR